MEKELGGIKIRCSGPFRRASSCVVEPTALDRLFSARTPRSKPSRSEILMSRPRKPTQLSRRPHKAQPFARTSTKASLSARPRERVDTLRPSDFKQKRTSKEKSFRVAPNPQVGQTHNTTSFLSVSDDKETSSLHELCRTSSRSSSFVDRRRQKEKEKKKGKTPHEREASVEGRHRGWPPAERCGRSLRGAKE